MAKTGPQRYPGASTRYWYQDDFGGSAMEVNTIVLHTTEGTSVPSYDGGAVAPNLTAYPDITNKRLLWYQHFDIETSSRALANKSGGVETNTLNVCQVELVGTCAPSLHTSWTKEKRPHVFWPEAPDWALQELARFLAWMNVNHKVPLTGPKVWLPYPSSYGATSARMTNAEWNAFSGTCGHEHAPEQDHGDPGSLDFARLLAFAKGQTPEEEDPMAGMTPKDVYNAVWSTDAMAPAKGAETPDNPTWQPQSVLRDVAERVRAMEIAVTRPQPVTLTDAQVAALAASPALAEAIAERVAQKLADRLKA